MEQRRTAAPGVPVGRAATAGGAEEQHAAVAGAAKEQRAVSPGLPAGRAAAAGAAEQRRAASPGVPAGRAVVEHEHVGGNPTETRERELCVDAKDFLVEFDPQRRLQMLCQYRIIVCRFYGGAFNGKRTCGDSTDVYMLFLQISC